MKTIKIDEKEYKVDIDKAIKGGYLIPVVSPVKAVVGESIMIQKI